MSMFVSDFTRDYHLNDQRFELVETSVESFVKAELMYLAPAYTTSQVVLTGKRDIQAQRRGKTLLLPTILIIE